MSLIPETIIEEIRGRLDIVNIVSQYLEIKKVGRNYTGLCPFHAEKTPSFTVSPEKQIYHCFGCQSGGNLFTFIMQIEDLSFPEAVRFLGEKAGVKVEDRNFTAEEKKAFLLKEKMQDLLNTAKKDYEEMLVKDLRGKKAYSYLTGRKVNGEAMRAFGLGFAPDAWDGLRGKLQSLKMELELAYRVGVLGKKGSRFYDYFRGRIIFPIWDHHGRLTGFGGRLIDQGEPRYLNTPETPLFSKGKTLYGLHLALPHIRREKEAVLVEGYLDVILLHQHGIKTAVAPLGTSLTENHVSLLRGRLESITMVFDGDAGGEKAAMRGLELLKNEGCRVRVAELPEGMDPADYILQNGPEHFNKDILGRARSLVSHQLYSIRKGNSLQKEEDRLQYWRKARKILANLSEPLEKEEYLKKIAVEINQPLEVLRGDLEKSSLGSRRSPGNNRKVLPAPKNTKSSLRELAEKELLSSVLQDPILSEELWEKIDPDFFTPGPFREIACSMHDLYLEGQEADVSTILGNFSNQEMHTLITKMATPVRRGEDARARKRMNDCLKRLRVLQWTEERERLQKSIQEQAGIEEISATLRKLQDLKVREEELYRSVEGENVDG